MFLRLTDYDGWSFYMAVDEISTIETDSRGYVNIKTKNPKLPTYTVRQSFDQISKMLEEANQVGQI